MDLKTDSDGIQDDADWVTAVNAFKGGALNEESFKCLLIDCALKPKIQPKVRQVATCRTFFKNQKAAKIR